MLDIYIYQWLIEQKIACCCVVFHICIKYFWYLYVLTVKPSKPICMMDGKLLEGSDVKLSCKSSDGSDPINYKWERVLDKGKSLGKLPNLALIGKEDNWHSTNMLIHHLNPLQRNAMKFHLVIFIGCIYSMKCWADAEHAAFPSPHPDSVHSYICKHWPVHVHSPGLPFAHQITIINIYNAFLKGT